MNEFILKAVQNDIRQNGVDILKEVYLAKTKQIWVGAAKFEYKGEYYACSITHMVQRDITADSLKEEILLEIDKEKERLDKYIYLDNKREYKYANEIKNHELYTIIKRQIIQLSNIYNKQINSDRYDQDYSRYYVEKKLREKNTPYEIYKEIKSIFYKDL